MHVLAILNDMYVQQLNKQLFTLNDLVKIALKEREREG
jgi:hypothetical protein